MWPLSFVSLLIFLSLSSLSHLPVSKSGTAKCIKHIVQRLATQEMYPYTFPVFQMCFFFSFSLLSLFAFSSSSSSLSLNSAYLLLLPLSLPAWFTLHLSVSLNTGFCTSMCLSLFLPLSLPVSWCHVFALGCYALFGIYMDQNMW